MPEKEAASAPTPDSASEKTRSTPPTWFQRIGAGLPETGRLLFWIGVTGALTAGMRAANHIIANAPKPDAQADVAPASRRSPGPDAAIWWSPTAPPDQMADSQPAAMRKDSTPSPSGTAGNSVIPVDRGVTLSAGALPLNSPINIGSANSREAYAILGLSRSSSPPISGGINGTLGATSAFSDQSGSATTLHFSLAGNLNLVPVDNLATSGTGVSLVAVPEPSTGAIIMAGLACLPWVRRRARTRVA